MSGLGAAVVAPASGTDPNTLDEFGAHWDFDTGVDNQAGLARSWTSKTQVGTAIAFDADYTCLTPDPQLGPNCDYGSGGGFPGAVASDGIRGTYNAGYIVRQLSNNGSYFSDLQAGFTKQAVVTVHGVTHPLPASPTTLGQNHKTEILFSDNRGSAGAGLGLSGGDAYAACWMNTDDFAPQGVHLGPITLGVKTLMTWHYTPPVTPGVSDDGIVVFEWGALSGSDDAVEGYRTADARLTLAGVIHAGAIWVGDPEPRCCNATIHQVLLMSPMVDKATYDETGLWLLSQ